MVRLILQRNRLTLLAFVVIPAAIAAIAAAWLLRPQTMSSAPLGDPNAPVVAATPAPFVGGQPPIARPAAAPVEAYRADDAPPPDAPANLIEARMPDARYHDAAFAAVQCAVGRPLTRDPEFDALAVEAWRAAVRSGNQRNYALLEQNNLRFIQMVPVERPTQSSSDACLFGGEDMRTQFGDLQDITSVGVAVFPYEGDYPFMTLVVVGR
ncbi:hypothetical protein [Roseiflexus sp.]|uniref:hypothetical protein n=1 Tax=Roseiflexus sp. TaxID=2562120 RepID=UPI0021DDB6D6|nr:hypothetical protein [Roseiflexus sp.]GIW00382.1 MAG: hypothetical protein KatS3mg058_1785 [Roseiflexus sp.]